LCPTFLPSLPLLKKQRLDRESHRILLSDLRKISGAGERPRADDRTGQALNPDSSPLSGDTSWLSIAILYPGRGITLEAVDVFDLRHTRKERRRLSQRCWRADLDCLS